MEKNGLKSKTSSVRYRAVCSEGDLSGSLYQTKDEALEVVFKHQEQKTNHQVKVIAVQTG